MSGADQWSMVGLAYVPLSSGPARIELGGAIPYAVARSGSFP